MEFTRMVFPSVSSKDVQIVKIPSPASRNFGYPLTNMFFSSIIKAVVVDSLNHEHKIFSTVLTDKGYVQVCPTRRALCQF